MHKIFYDITLPIDSHMTVYPGDPDTSVLPITSDDGCTISNISCSSHCGTHVDAPRHFIVGGKPIDDVSLDHFIGKVKIFEIPDVICIEEHHLKHLDIEKGDIIFFKTRNSSFIRDSVFREDYTFLSECSANYLAHLKIKTVGIDYYSIEEYNSCSKVHKILLGNNIIIIEGLVLTDIEPSEYQLLALPLKIKGCDGSPMRVILSPMSK